MSIRPMFERIAAGAAVIATTLAAGGALVAPATAGETVNVYSYRQPFLIKPLFDAFTARTGIQVKYLFAKKGLIERIAQEGENTPADVLLTADVGRLVQAARRGILAPVSDPAIEAAIPANLRDEHGRWFGLTMRARVVFASRQRVKADTVTYAELADAKWKGKICIRSGQHPYNVALVAAAIAHWGRDKTRTWLEGLKANLARRPAGNDRAQAKAVFAGECDLAIANTYYYGKMATNEKHPEQKQWAAATRIIFPTFENGRTHVNISGMGLIKHAGKRKAARQLMAFLASAEAQRIYAEGNFEYPVNPKVPASELVRSWGQFQPDDLRIEKLAEFQAEASRLIDEVGFNE